MNRSISVGATVMLALLTGPGNLPQAGPSGGRPRGAARHMLELVNNERRNRGVAPFIWSAELAHLASRHAADMKRAGRLSHLTARDSADLSDRLISADLPALLAAENIARGADIDDAHSGLMNSPGHRRNILNPALERIGIGLAEDPTRGTVWVCQDFATLIPRFSNVEAHQRLRDALVTAWRIAGGSIREDDLVSRGLRGTLDRMVKKDRLTVASIDVPGPAWVYAYSTPDPGQLPENVLSRAGRALQFGAAIGFQRTPSTPMGLYWVAIALTGRADPPER